MAITAGTGADLGATTGTSHTASYTVAVGDDNALIVTIAVVTNPVNGDDLLTVTYAGFACTLVGSRESNTTGNWLYQYKLQGAPVGAADVVVTCAHSNNIRVGAQILFGVRTYAQPDASNTNGTAAGTSLATAVTTVLDNCWTVLSAMNLSGDSGNLGAVDCTRRAIDGAVTPIWACYDSNGPKTPAGSKTMTFGGGAVPGALTAVMSSWAPTLAATVGSIAFDNAKSVESVTDSVLSFDFTVGAGASRVLIVTALHAYNSAFRTNVDSVVFNGLALERAQFVGWAFPGYLTRGGQYVLYDPPVGTHTVTITLNVASAALGAFAQSYSQFDLVVNPDASGVGTGTSPITATVATTRDNCWIIGMAGGDFVDTGVAVDSGGILRATDTDNMRGVFDSNGPLSIGSHDVTCSGIGSAAVWLLAFAPQPVVYLSPSSGGGG